MTELHRGVVKWFNDAKGFGFIEHESGRDVFVHYSVIEQEGFKTLKDGEEVEYELKEGDKGLNAARVLRLEAPIKDASMDAVRPGSEQAVAPSQTTASAIEVVREEDKKEQVGTLAETASQDTITASPASD